MISQGEKLSNILKHINKDSTSKSFGDITGVIDDNGMVSIKFYKAKFTINVMPHRSTFAVIREPVSNYKITNREIVKEIRKVVEED